MQQETHTCQREQCRDIECCEVKMREQLRNVDGRLTRERLAVLQAICDYGVHFTPEQLQKFLSDRGQPVAMTTIYRNLPALESAGIIRRTTFQEEQGLGASTYEHVWGRPHHDHLICGACGRKVEFHYDAIEVLQREVARKYGFELVKHHMELVGLCPECRTEDPGGPKESLS